MEELQRFTAELVRATRLYLDAVYYILTHAGEWMESIWRVLVGGGAYSWDTLGELLWRRPARLVQESSKRGGYVTCSFPCMCMNESMICAAVRAGSLGQGHVWNFVFIHAACNMMDICSRIALSCPCACACISISFCACVITCNHL